MAGAPHAGQPGSEDQHVDMVHGRGVYAALRSHPRGSLLTRPPPGPPTVGDPARSELEPRP